MHQSYGGAGAVNPSQPLLNVTHDGGQTWQSVTLPALPGANSYDMVETTPPVIFDNGYGLLPVQDTSPSRPGTDLYVTHDGGQSWSPTKFIILQGSSSLTVHIIDMQHVWAALGTDLYATSDGGQSWTKLSSIPQTIGMMSFIDAKNGWAVGPRDIPFDINDPNQIAKDTNSGKPLLLHTTDGGQTWQQINYSIQLGTIRRS